MMERTAVILAGGASRRMGSDKLALRYGGETLLESAVRRFEGHFDSVYLSLADASKYPGIGALRVTDLFPSCGPIGGLHAALETAEGEGVFLVAADMPFSDPLAALRVIELCGDHDACVMTDAAGRPEPLFGYYKKAIGPVVEGQIAGGRYKIAGFFPKIRLRMVKPAELGALWSGELLMNVNRPEDYEKLIESF